MSRARHKKSDGGKVDSDKAPTEVYAGKGSNVEKEADDDKDGGEMKKGGRVKRAKGGKVEHKVEGEPAKRRLDRPGRKRGGACGSDMSPLSSAGKYD